MNTFTRAYRKLVLGMIAIAFVFSLSGCDYEVPITSAPTRKIDERLLGDWVSVEGKDKMKVRKLDDSIYIVSYNDDLLRAFHSDVAKTPFLSVQDLDSSRTYTYLTYRLSEDGRQLGLRAVSDKVIPKETKDSVSIQKLLKKNLQNPQLLQDEGLFNKEK